MNVSMHYGDMRFHHIGVITGNLEESIALYTSLEYSASIIYADPIQKAHIVLMQREHEPIIELISPDGPERPAASWVQRIQVGPYHTGYEVDDVEAAIAFLRHQRLFPVLGPVPAVAFNMQHVVFFWGKNCGLIELLDSGNGCKGCVEEGMYAGRCLGVAASV